MEITRREPPRRPRKVSVTIRAGPGFHTESKALALQHERIQQLYLKHPGGRPGAVLNMLTGVESAGLVLAAFPLVISGVQAYREGLKPLRSWWQYRTQVLELSEAVDSQHLMFLQNVELLLDPIVTSSVHMNYLLNSTATGDPAWENPKLAERLLQRLSISYNLYMSTVGRMRETLKDLEGHLGIVDGKVIPGKRCV